MCSSTVSPTLLLKSIASEVPKAEKVGQGFSDSFVLIFLDVFFLFLELGCWTKNKHMLFSHGLLPVPTMCTDMRLYLFTCLETSPNCKCYLHSHNFFTPKIPNVNVVAIALWIFQFQFQFHGPACQSSI